MGRSGVVECTDEPVDFGGRIRRSRSGGRQVMLPDSLPVNNRLGPSTDEGIHRAAGDVFGTSVTVTQRGLQGRFGRRTIREVSSRRVAKVQQQLKLETRSGMGEGYVACVGQLHDVVPNPVSNRHVRIDDPPYAIEL